MASSVKTVALKGIDPQIVDVQVQIAPGLPSFTIVGLPDKAVGESKERVRAAFASMGLALPTKRITVNLAPADLQKEGSHYDLPIALAVLQAMEIISEQDLSRYIALGELALDGSLDKIVGVLPAAMAANGMDNGIICPYLNGPEAAWAGELDILAAPSLTTIINHFKGRQILTPPERSLHMDVDDDHMLDISDIKGQIIAKRALEIAATGGHHLLMLGPPGSGKSMLAARLAGLLPPMDPQEMLETSLIYSVLGLLEQGQLQTKRPYRDPHHSASLAALVGGGQKAKPGEISLAHNGVLFLDELPEFQPRVIESLRQPMEAGRVSIARVQGHVTYPAQFQLIAAMNPCKCGFFGDAEASCARVPKCGIDYQSRISGPMFDRIDLFVDVLGLKPSDFTFTKPLSANSKTLKQKILNARAIQQERYKGRDIKINARADGQLLEDTLMLQDKAKALANQAADKLKLSARGFYRLLRVARTIGDLEESLETTQIHVAEALSFRRQAPQQLKV